MGLQIEEVLNKVRMACRLHILVSCHAHFYRRKNKKKCLGRRYMHTYPIVIVSIITTPLFIIPTNHLNTYMCVSVVC